MEAARTTIRANVATGLRIAVTLLDAAGGAL
jgi:hypothetical protein